MVGLGQGPAARGSEGDGGVGINPRSFSAFYERYKPLLFRWFLGRTHNEHLASELTARTFLTALEQHGQQRGRSEEEAVGWVLKIARTELLQYLRRGRIETSAIAVLTRETPVWADDDTGRVDQLVDAEAARTPLTLALSRISRQQREVFERRFVREESVAEVAAAMGISEIAVRTAVFRVRRRLERDDDLRSIFLGDRHHG